MAESSIVDGDEIYCDVMPLSLSLSKANLHRWKYECHKLNLTNDEYFELLLDAYQQSFNKNGNLLAQSYKNNITSEDNRLLFLKLNQQRLKNSSCCDFHFTIPGMNKSVYYSAHTCVLVSLLGDAFHIKLTDIIAAQKLESENKLIINEKEIVMMPSGFELLVEFLYTKKFLIEKQITSNDTLTSLIKSLVDHEGTRNLLLEKLNQPPSVKSDACIEDALNSIAEQIFTPDITQLYSQNNFDNGDFTMYDDLKVSSPSDSIVDSNLIVNAQGIQSNNEIIQISTSKSQKQLSTTFQKTGIENDAGIINCPHCNEEFPTRAELRKHVTFDHIKTSPAQNTRRKNMRNYTRNYVTTWRKTKKALNMNGRPIGACCDEEFPNGLKFGIHIFQKHCAVFATCSDCKALVLLNELVCHYQVIHDYGPYVSNKALSKDHCSKQNNILSQNLDQTGLASSQHTIPDIITPVPSVDDSTLDQNFPVSSLWLQQVTCIGCQKQMTVIDYVGHLKDQFDSAMDLIEVKHINLHKTHRCLLYQCQLCQSNRTAPEKAIRLYLLLTKHIGRYHKTGSTGDDKVNCVKCGKLIVKFYLDSHMKTHSLATDDVKAVKYPCDICGKVVNKKRISVHRRLHFEKFSCQYCSKLFNRKANCQVHERIHTGEKPFVCDVCGKSFRQNIELKLHNRKHEKEKLQNLPKMLTNEPGKYWFM